MALRAGFTTGFLQKAHESEFTTLNHEKERNEIREKTLKLANKEYQSAEVSPNVK